MLQDIVASKHGSDLLSFLLMAPMRTYSVEELSKRLRFSKPILTKALQQLQTLSMIKQLTVGRNHYYMLSRKHGLLPEVKKSLLKNQKPYEDELCVAVKKLGDVQAAFLSGLFTGHSDLPVDILIVGKINLNKLSQFLESCKKMMGKEINYSIMTADEFKLRRDTFDRFIKDVFDYDHLVIVDKLSQEKTK
jgi:predicted transcriptional regulator